MSLKIIEEPKIIIGGETPVAENLIINPGFEIGNLTTFLVPGWDDMDSTLRLALGARTGGTGTKVGQATAFLGMASMKTCFKTETGKEYKFTYWTKNVTTNAGPHWKLIIRDSVIASAIATIDVGHADTWLYGETTFTALGTITEIWIYGGPDANPKLQVDDFSVLEV